ncbi:class I adenylate-forming enzyme family protein [Francisella frigiditurris]|uniref:AMP-binding enzyme family protein n=1 Tax=Francisella frigiditurris TaxID=1542390 RepID=A0A1J0KW35_9GAMM|nr:fatty acid--CoA ligase family protein [Francisella frigiditurris]APC97836.1 AMP-binding enzyme family protein [Francisella frigiditurris]
MLSYIDTFFKKIASHLEDRKITFKNEEYSYKEILDRGYILASWINGKAHKKVFFNFKNSHNTISLYLAGMIADIEYLIPINPRLVTHELENILEEKSLFITDKIDNDLKLFCKKNNIEIINADFLNNLLDSKSNTDYVEVKGKAIFSHISSGTTGRYCQHPHRIKQIINYAYERVNDLGLKADDKILIALSLNHAFAFSYQLLPALVMGLDIVIIREFNPKIVAEQILKNKVTAIALLPTMYHFLFKENLDKNMLRYLGVAGDQPSEDLFLQAKNILKLPLLNGIGMTEVFGYGQNIIQAQSTNQVKIFDDTQVKISKFKNSDYGKIFIKNSMIPINNNSEWLDTGDIGSFNSNTRTLHFYGRKKDIIIKGGSNIAPIEIEEAIKKYPKITDAIVVGKKDDIWGELVCAFIVSKSEISLEELNTHLDHYIAKYKKLDKVIEIKEIPVTKTGKTDREKLKKLATN